ncbi:MAG TPA: site-2 protease family protein [Terriglobales bacterium]|nr:site-2 protease family protein [Terriglobales bacterium]
MRSWSIPAGKIFGTEIRVHLSFFALPLFIWWTEFAAHNGNADGARDLALLGIIFASVVLHEVGHAVLSHRLGLVPKSVILLPIGGVAMIDDSRALTESLGKQTDWKREIRIAAVGPAVSLFFGLLAAAIILAVVPGVQLWTWPFLLPSNLLRSVVWANLYIAALNLLPAYPMDGGRILRAFFLKRMDPVRATREATSIAKAIAVLLMFTGIWNVWLTLVGVLLFVGAQLEERSVVFQSVLENVRMDDIMLTDFATLSPADTLEDALEKAVHSLQDDFPVIRGSDMVGVVSKQKILQALRSEGNGYIQSVMSRIFEVANRSETLASAFRKLTAKNLSIIPVVEDQRLVGIVTLQNLMHSMALLAESRKLRRQALNS